MKIKIDCERALSISQTTCINGIFVILVFMSHFCQYIDTASISYFKPYLFLRAHLGQLIVAPFLFYSGYGIMEQIQKKGNEYVNDIPRKRVIRIWLHFALAVLLFLIVDVLIGDYYSTNQIILSFFAWESIGNSNWYIFAILCMYIATYVGFKCCSQKKTSIILVGAFSCIYIVTMHFFKDGSWWYDTVLCYPAGMALSYSKDKFQRCIERYKLPALITCALITLFLYMLLYMLQGNIISHELLAIVFCFDIILICSFIRIENQVLLFLGKHTFEIYILQRIPMILLQNRNGGGYAYLILSFICTIVISILFKKLERKVDLLFKL